MGTLTPYECIVDRDCNDYYVAETPCDQVETRAGPGDPCGNEKHGGERCKATCCAAQVRYCMDTATPLECIVDRDLNDYYVAETPCDRVEIRAGPGDPCGNDKHRGERCKATCCAAQVSYCMDTATPFECIVDRDVNDYYVAETPCDQVEIRAGPGDPCGNDKHGGERCKANCCVAQLSYCKGTLTPYECIDDRDCNDYYVAETPCDQVETRAGPGDPCGSEKHGGERCKTN
jgi:hypothetical protein